MSMEETAVLLSIRPEWCQKIFRGEKTMEIRKNFPKDFRGQPFKCFIYCTKGQNAGFRMEPDGSLLRLDGTVIGEFTCDRVYEIAPLNHAPDDLEAQACMDRDQIWKYTHGKGYAWHITELKTYETPLDLSAFHLRCENALRWCNNGGCAMHIEQPANGNCCGNYGLQLNRPPQSWCYVVGPGECHKELQEQVKATLNRLYPRKKVSDILPKPEILGQLAEELAAAARRAGVPLWIKDSEEIRAVIGGEPAQALPDALKRPKDRPTPHCAECEHCVKAQEGKRGTRKECAIGWTAEGYEDGGARHIPTRGNRQSPDWCPRRKDDAE